LTQECDYSDSLDFRIGFDDVDLTLLFWSGLCIYGRLKSAALEKAVTCSNSVLAQRLMAETCFGGASFGFQTRCHNDQACALCWWWHRWL
jgi:hypothetical protein